MKISKVSGIFLMLLIVVTGCRKDDPVVAHSRLTRIDYNIARPQEMPNIAFTFNDTYDLKGNSRCFVVLTANNKTVSLNLTIILEDDEGNRTDENPFIIRDRQLIKDDKSHTYLYSFKNNLGSSTGPEGKINIRRIKKVLIFINAGDEALVSEGTFWLDRVQFEGD